MVLDVAEARDPSAADQRLTVLANIDTLEITSDALRLAESIVAEGSIPESSAADALHIAIAVTTGCEYLVSWNHRHMVNALLRMRVENLCRVNGYEATLICTPEELMEG